MAYYAFKLDADLSGEIHHKCGSFNVLQIDGRYSLQRAIDETREWLGRTGQYRGFELFKGRSLRDVRRIHREVTPCTIAETNDRFIQTLCPRKHCRGVVSKTLSTDGDTYTCEKCHVDFYEFEVIKL